jgi:uncharacterized integral membrane protein (TIGR02327 family)
MTLPNDLQIPLGFGGLISIATVILCIWMSWWALQEFRFDLFVKRPKSPQSKLLQLLLAVAIGYQTAKFVMDYFAWSVTLSSLKTLKDMF